MSRFDGWNSAMPKLVCLLILIVLTSTLFSSKADQFANELHEHNTLIDALDQNAIGSTRFLLISNRFDFTVSSFLKHTKKDKLKKGKLKDKTPIFLKSKKDINDINKSLKYKYRQYTIDTLPMLFGMPNINKCWVGSVNRFIIQ